MVVRLRMVPLLLIVGLLVPLVSAQVADGHRTAVCHIPANDPGKSRTLLIDQSALPAHLEHGDYAGMCIPDMCRVAITETDEYVAFFQVPGDEFDMLNRYSSEHTSQSYIDPATGELVIVAATTNYWWAGGHWVLLFEGVSQSDWRVRFSNCTLPVFPPLHILLEDTSGRRAVVHIPDFWVQTDTTYFTVAVSGFPQYEEGIKVEHIGSQWMLGNTGEELDIVRDSNFGIFADN